MRSLNFFGSFVATFLLISCGGGGAGGSNTINLPSTNSITSKAFDCDENAQTVLAQKAVPFVYQLADTQFAAPEKPNVGFSIESMRTEIDGISETLNVVIYSKNGGVALRGIAIIAHGHSPAYEKAPAAALGAENYATAYPFLQKGFVPIVVARRGNFGSSGGRLIDFGANGMLSDYSKGSIDYSVLARTATEYQAASITAVLDSLKNDARFKSLMNQIIVVGTSGGAPTVLQFAADSQVFRNAKFKAVARITGYDTAHDINPDAAYGARKYMFELAKKVDISSFWLGGTDDSITSFGKLACEYKFYSEGNTSNKSVFLGSPGFGHGPDLALFTDSIYPLFKKYLEDVGFIQF